MDIRRSISQTMTAAALTAVAAAGLAGCSSAAEQIPPDEKEAINLGANATIGDVEVDNLLLVSRGESEPARLIGVLLNDSTETVELTLADSDDRVAVSLEPGQQYAFQENETLFDTADAQPGSYTDIALSLSGSDDTETASVPVRDGSLNWLSPYVPAAGG
jgi:hypothetical protein